MKDEMLTSAGQIRRSDKNIGVSWHQVPMCLKNMCDDAQVWVQTQNESPEEMAVRFHHRLVWIHPFSNGNGRHARLMADIFIENVLHGAPFFWETTHHIALNQITKGFRVPSKMVPAMTDV